MKCLRCGPLIKAIDAYLAKAENDLYEQLTMEGYLKAKESLNTVDEIEEVVTKLLEDNADDLLKELADAIDLETFFKDNWPKFKNKSKLAQDLFDVFHTQFSTIMPTYVEAYVQKTDAELTVTKLTKRTTDWISSWSSDLADIMKLDTETEIEAVLQKGLNDGKGIMDDANSDYYAAHGSDVVTCVGCVLTGDLPLTALDAESGSVVDDVINFNIKNII